MTGEAGVWFPRDHILSWNLASPPRWSIQNEGLPRVVILYSVGSSYSPGGVGAREWQNWGSDSERTPEKRGFWVALLVKSPSANAGDLRDTGSIPGSGRSPGGGHSNPLQCSCLEKPMDRGACGLWSMGSQSQTQLSWLSTYLSIHPSIYKER